MYFCVKPKGTFKKSKNWMNSYRLLDFFKVSLKLCGIWIPIQFCPSWPFMSFIFISFILFQFFFFIPVLVFSYSLLLFLPFLHSCIFYLSSYVQSPHLFAICLNDIFAYIDGSRSVGHFWSLTRVVMGNVSKRYYWLEYFLVVLF